MLDPLRARAEADAAERRGAGTLWAPGPVAWEGVTAGTVAQPEVVPTVEDAVDEAPPARPRVAELRRAEATRALSPRVTEAVPTALLAAILARLDMMPPAGGGGARVARRGHRQPAQLRRGGAAPEGRVRAGGPGAVPEVAGHEGAPRAADDGRGVGVRAAGGAGGGRARAPRVERETSHAVVSGARQLRVCWGDGKFNGLRL